VLFVGGGWGGKGPGQKKEFHALNSKCFIGHL
jgi:hypothetical protein